MGRFYILQLSTHKATSTTQTTYGERRNGRDGNCVEVTSMILFSIYQITCRVRYAVSIHDIDMFAIPRPLLVPWYQVVPVTRYIPGF